MQSLKQKQKYDGEWKSVTIGDKQYHETAFPPAHMQHHCAVKRNPRGGFQWEYCDAVSDPESP